MRTQCDGLYRVFKFGSKQVDEYSRAVRQDEEELGHVTTSARESSANTAVTSETVSSGASMSTEDNTGHGDDQGPEHHGHRETPGASRGWNLPVKLGIATLVSVLFAGVFGAVAVRDGLANRVLIAVVLLLVALFAAAVVLVVSRRLLRSLRELHRGANQVARVNLPSAVADVRAGKAISGKIEPVAVHGDDTVGQVARAFDAVHAEARSLAVEQANMRTTYGTMFVNLSRRSQTLVQRQLRLIEQLERDEEDPEQLGTLFQLDHLATRMRRNNENLMVLSGAEPHRGAGLQPVSLGDLLRAAVSEIEQYRRVVLEPPPQATVLGYASGDLVRLIAELLDNATAFSAPDTMVTVSTVQDPDDSILIEIRDAGIGMRADDLAKANERLAAQRVDEVPASRRMGPFVVGKLAERQGVRVALRPANADDETAGLAAGVRVPGELLASPIPADGGLGVEFGQRERNGEDTAETVLPLPAKPYEPTGRPANGVAPNGKPKTNGIPAARKEPEPALPRRQAAPTERTPIFDAMLSVWFADPGMAAMVRGGEGAESDQSWAFDAREREESAERVADAAAGGEDSQRWRFAADDGWQAVEQVAEAEPDAFTKAGLPRRTPRARLLPGSAPKEQAGGEQQEAVEQPQRDPAKVRTRMASFQRGVRNGRHSLGVPQHAAEQPVPDDISEADTELFAAVVVPEPVKDPEPAVGNGTDWSFAADEGQRASEAAVRTPADSVTKAGLPRRTPKARLVPGSASERDRVPVPKADPQGVRSRLSNFQRGLSAGRRSVGIPEETSAEPAYQWGEPFSAEDTAGATPAEEFSLLGSDPRKPDAEGKT